MPRVTAAAKLTLLLFMLAVISLGVVVRLLWLSVPSAEAHLEIAPQTSNERVFACVEQAVAELGNGDKRWLSQVSHRDLRAGRLETGRFPEDDVTGFRLRLDHSPPQGRIDIRLKGDGAHWVDHGVEEALAGLERNLRRCLTNPTAAVWR